MGMNVRGEVLGGRRPKCAGLVQRQTRVREDVLIASREMDGSDKAQYAPCLYWL